MSILARLWVLMAMLSSCWETREWVGESGLLIAAEAQQIARRPPAANSQEETGTRPKILRRRPPPTAPSHAA